MDRFYCAICQEQKSKVNCQNTFLSHGSHQPWFYSLDSVSQLSWY